MASEYKKRGDGYNTDKKDQDESQKHLSQWTEEEWQTKEGSGNAKQADGMQKRYLPKKGWEEMTEEEKEETDEKKMEGSKEGKQFVQNTGRAKSARQKANKEKKDEIETRKAEEKELENTSKKGAKAGKTEENGQENPKAGNPANTGQKRSRTQPNSDKEHPSKRSKTASRSKTVGSKHDAADAPAEQASADRLPEKGQTVHWKSLPGWVEGTVVEVVYENREVEGKTVKAKKGDPRIVMRSKNGKIAVHKPQAVYFD
jgi:hypothetical protein